MMEKLVPQLFSQKLELLGIDLKKSLWNVYSGILAYDVDDLSYEIISIGSGVKCLPDESIFQHPRSLVHDSHAEIICRRSFILFIYEQLILLKEKKLSHSQYLTYDSSKGLYVWNEKKKLILYSSQSPCNSVHIFFAKLHF
jgi:tRNA-specific adenosine deaminase 1